jgi:hypothetical protein
VKNDLCPTGVRSDAETREPVRDAKAAPATATAEEVAGCAHCRGNAAAAQEAASERPALLQALCLPARLPV